MTRDGELATRDYLALVLSGIGKESDIGVVQSLHRQVKLALDLYADPDVARGGPDAAGRTPRWRTCGPPQPGSDHQLAWARAFAATARTAEQLDLLQALLDGTADHRGPGRRHRAALGVRWSGWPRPAGADEDGDRRRAASATRRRPASGTRPTARAARPTAEAKAEAWASVVESDKLPNAVQEAVIGGFVQTDQRELLAPYTEKYFAAVKDVWDSRAATRWRQQIAVGLYPALQVSQETLDATDAWLASAEPSAALRRLVSESRAGVERALRAQAADAAAAGRRRRPAAPDRSGPGRRPCLVPRLRRARRGPRGGRASPRAARRTSRPPRPGRPCTARAPPGP